MKILISPFAQKMRNKERNPKEYPHWERLLKLLKGHEIIQIGVPKEEKLVHDFRILKLKEIKQLLKEVDLFISVDSFLPHLAKHVNKKGIVIFGQSDPQLFGYPENINIIKDNKYLRDNQYDIWENAKYRYDVFVEPEVIADIVKNWKVDDGRNN